MSRANRILAIALAAIVVLAVIAAVISTNRPTAELEPGSPEATVQAYVEAVLDGKVDQAARLLDPDGDCDIDDLTRYSGPGTETARVVLVDTTTEGSGEARTATVAVELVYSSGGPFDGSEFSDKHTYLLKRSEGTWVLTGVPWPLFDCTGKES